MPARTPDRTDALASVEQGPGTGDPEAATASLLPPDALAAALDRLMQLVARQDEQIRTLRALLEEAL